MAKEIVNVMISEEEVEKKEEVEDYGDFEVDEAMTHF